MDTDRCVISSLEDVWKSTGSAQAKSLFPCLSLPVCLTKRSGSMTNDEQDETLSELSVSIPVCLTKRSGSMTNDERDGKLSELDKTHSEQNLRTFQAPRI